MTMYSAFHYDILLVHMLKDQSILHTACSTLEAPFLASPEVGGTQVQAIMFLTIKDFYQKYKTAPDLAALNAELMSKFARLNPFGTIDSIPREIIEWFVEFGKLIPVVDSKSLPLARDILAFIHRVCVYEPQVKLAAEQAMDSRELDDLGPQLVSLTLAHNAVKGSNRTSSEVVLTDEDVVMRVTTGISFIDRVLGDGQGPAYPGVVGIIAGQGSGKTTLGVQMVLAQASLGRHSILALAENGWQDRAVQLSALACCTGIDFKILEKAKDLRAAAAAAGLDVELCVRKAAAMKEYAHIVDLASSGGDLAEVDARIAELIQEGRKPSLAYIDWAGCIAERMLNNPRGSRKMKDKREALEAISTEVASMAERHQMLIVISQQMNADYVRRGRFGQYDHYCAHEDRMFTANFKYVATITTTGDDPQGRHGDVQVLEWVKARVDASKTKTLLRRHAPTASFIEATDVVKKGKSFVPIGSAAKSDFSIPAERSRNATATE
jgi:hypothetical protein